MRTLGVALFLSFYPSLFVGTSAAVSLTLDAPPKRIVVPPGATGDDLLKAIETVAENGEVVVGAGTFYINRPIHISKSFTLQGSGAERTRLVLESGGVVIQFFVLQLPSFLTDTTGEDENNGFSESQHGETNTGLAHPAIIIPAEPSEDTHSHNWFAARDIHFDYKGTSPANVIIAWDGQLRFYRCKFSGGTSDCAGSWSGNGVALLGSTQALFSECVFLRNACNGISALGGTSVRIIDCWFENNLNGIAIFGSARGEVRNSRCYRNTGSGIFATDRSNLIVIDSVCSHNGTGIALDGSARAELQRNECSENTYSGIVASSHSQLIAEGNRCSQNRFGIALEGSARGEVRNNGCIDNTTVGIIARGQSHLIADNNQCKGNGLGIALLGSVQAKITANTCMDNQFVDIVYQRTVTAKFNGNIGKVKKFENLNNHGNSSQLSSQPKRKKQNVPKRSSGKRARAHSNR